MSNSAAGPAGTPFRLDAGGRIDRSVTLPFTFDGRALAGHPGDSLASALLAAGVRTVARSVELGRPRGVFTDGAEEPNALVRVESGVCPEPMLPATRVELYAGLNARGLAGKGILAPGPDPARYDHAHIHCDVLVVGAGPAGLAAAYAAGVTGARVILVDERPELGGHLLASKVYLDGEAATRWVRELAARLGELPETRVLTRTTALGYYDHNYVVALEQRTDHLGDAAPAHVSRQRLWHVRAGQGVLATGAHERPLAFADNDRPGVMLASAARAYVNRYAVAAGRRAVVFTTNDSAYAAALDLIDAGVAVAAIVDVRPEPGGQPAGRADGWPALARRRGIEVLRGQAVTGTEAGTSGELRAVRVGRRGGAAERSTREIDADLLAVSGGWNPAVHLFSQSQGRLRYDDRLAAFIPDVPAQPQRSVGAARGVFGTAAVIADGFAAGAEAAERAGFTASLNHRVPRDGQPPEDAPAAFWAVPAVDPDEAARQFVDLQRDVTVRDVERATDSGMRSVEHVKRFTTVGTASDQGKTSGVVAIGVVAELLGRSPGETGTTTSRPPYVPVAFAALAGPDRGPLSDPARVTPIHDWHVAHGAVFEDVGQWKRPWYYPRAGEDMTAAVLRECRAARGSVGVFDASTLGKIDIQGPDAAEFLDRIYTNTFSTLRVGACRYGLMCGVDGMVLDDGVTTRLGPRHFLMTTTTGNAATVLDWLEEWLQTEWPDLRVFCTSATDHWATIAVVGPRSRDVLATIAPSLPVDAESFPFMTVRETVLGLGEVAGVPARVCRISFSGELSYEVNVPAWYGLAVWEAVMTAGHRHGITPYGTEAMHVLRAEKGYPAVGQETDGTITPHDLGMDRVVSKKKRDFVGRRSLRRPDNRRADRRRLVGLVTEDPEVVLPEGAQVAVTPGSPSAATVGHVTSSYRSATLGRSFALALVRADIAGVGSRLHVRLAERICPVTVTEPVFYDPDGSRRDG